MAFNSLRLSQTPATVSSGKKALWKDAIIKCLCKWMEKRKFAICFKQNAFSKKKTKKENNSNNNNENANFLLTHILKCKKNKKRTFSLFCHFFAIYVYIYCHFSLHFITSISFYLSPPDHDTNLRKYQMPSVCHRSHIYAATSRPAPHNP